MATSRKRRSTSRSPPRTPSSFSLPPKTTFPGFALRFAFFFGLPYALLHVVPLGFLLDAIAAVESALLHFFGVESVRFGAFLSSNAAWFQIVPDCSGLVMVILLGGLLWSTPVRHPLRFFARFTPLLFVWNFVRLFAVLYAGGVWGQVVQDWLHIGLWMVDAGLVLALWWVAFSGDANRFAFRGKARRSPKKRQKRAFRQA